MKNTKLISAFPGCGKSYAFKNYKDIEIADSDSSKFDKKNFPENYIQHIKDNIGKKDIIMISSHKEVRDALVKEGLSFILVYPEKEIKEEFLQRYKDRKSPKAFIDLLDKNWEAWIDELENQINCTHIKLSKGEYLSDHLKEIYPKSIVESFREFHNLS